MVCVQTQLKPFFIDHLHITTCVLYWIARGLNSPSITFHPIGRSCASSLCFPFLFFFLIGLNVFRFDFQNACLICPFEASSSLLDFIAPESLVICTHITITYITSRVFALVLWLPNLLLSWLFSNNCNFHVSFIVKGDVSQTHKATITQPHKHFLYSIAHCICIR